MAAAGPAIILPKQAIPVACPRAHSVRIQARFMSETRLRLFSNTTWRQKTREPAPSTVLAQILHRLSAPESWASATRRELRLVIDLSIDNTVAAPEVDCLHPAGRSGRRSCLPSVMPLETCFQKMAGVSSFARGNPSVAGDVRGIRRQTTMPRSIKGLVARCRTLPPRSGTACSRSLQALIHNAGILPPYPADVFDGVSRKPDEAVPAQSARHDPARSRPLSRAEGDLAIDRQRELIGALPRTRFQAPPMPPASRLTVACSL